jgi:HSP20 family protein
MLVRWDPFDEMNRLHDQLFRGWGSTERQAFRLAVDIREVEDAFLVEAEVPGIAADDVHVDVEKNVLTIRGERNVEKEEKQDTFRRIERHYGSFSRSFTLPDSVDTDNISADLRDGVLALRIPKKEAPQPRKINVKSGS